MGDEADMTIKNELLTGVEILPEQLRGEVGRRAILATLKLQKIIEKAHATLEGNVRLFLQEHCGVTGARDLETPMETIKHRMRLMNVEVRHVNVQKKPQLSGTWIIQSGKPLVSFPDPKMKNGKLLPQMMILLQSSTIQVVSGLQGNA